MDEVSVRISNLDIMDAYYRVTLSPYDIDNFTYVVPYVPEDNGIIFCINLVLSMRWVDTPKFFCALS